MKKRWYIKCHDDRNDIGADWKRCTPLVTTSDEIWKHAVRWWYLTAICFNSAEKHDVLLRDFQKVEEFLKEHFDMQ